MRHIGSFLLASIFAPVILVLSDLGLSGVDSARKGSFTDDPFAALAALGTLFLAGLMYGVLVMARLSPVGPGFAGLALIGTSSWAVLDPWRYQETIGMMGGAVGQLGLGILLGAPLIATLTSPRRWRSGYADLPQPSTSESTDLATSETLIDVMPFRPPVADPPPALLPPASPPASASPPGEPALPLPRRTPTVPLPMISRRTDGPTTVPIDEEEIPWPGEKGKHRQEP